MRFIDRSGLRYGRLLVIDRAGNRGKGVLWNCVCDCGSKTQVVGWNLNSGHTRSCGCLSDEMLALHRPQAVEIPGYRAAHNRVRTEHGSARLHACRNCGDPAAQWAYDYNDPQELQGVMRGASLRYSAHPEHYVPLCCSCHVSADKRGAWVDGQVRL